MAKESPITRFVDTTRQQKVTRSVTRVGNAPTASLLSCLALYLILLEQPSKILYPKSPTRGSQPTWCHSKRNNIINPSIDPMHVFNLERKKLLATVNIQCSLFLISSTPHLILSSTFFPILAVQDGCEGRKEEFIFQNTR